MSKDPPVAIDAVGGDGKEKWPPKRRVLITDPGADVVLSATIKGQVDVKKVIFFDGDAAVGEATQSPWRMTWRAAGSRAHGIYAEWVSSEGKRGVTNPGLIVVTKP